jgi:flavin reductase (DIM6/NTAB) family NADH-FMN oxidoreductase RutF
MQASPAIFYLDAPLPHKYDASTMETLTVMTLDPEQLRSAMRAWTTGVTLVTASYDGDQHGMTVNSFTSISLNPAIISISLQTSSRTNDLVTKAGAFGLTILSAEQAQLSELFAGRSTEAENRFADVETETLITGAPLIKGGLAWLDCRVVHSYDAGMNRLFVAEVVAARGTGEGLPLVYHNRKYWGLTET